MITPCGDSPNSLGRCDATWWETRLSRRSMPQTGHSTSRIVVVAELPEETALISMGRQVAWDTSRVDVSSSCLDSTAMKPAKVGDTGPGHVTHAKRERYAREDIFLEQTMLTYPYR
ncbi:hypothetical protein C8039_12315 [Halogeometricum sp. wsp3]|nr:hypothetical protein C8039_12315 [Halogeometricum sp. wsp3]